MLLLAGAGYWGTQPAIVANVQSPVQTPTATPQLAYAPLMRYDEPPTATATATPTDTPTATNTPPPTATPTNTAPPTSTPTPTNTAIGSPCDPRGTTWLPYVNQFRDQANLPALVENATWSYGDCLHGRYMVKNDYIGHSEDPGNPWYSPEGLAAAQNGNVMVSSSTGTPDESAVNLWMAGPFHAVGIIDPRLATTGFGSYREAIGTWRMGATLDVIRGRGGLPGGVTFPLPYPRDGGHAWLTRYDGNEAPDPLTSCPGYTAPSGSPLILQLGTGSITPSVTASSLLRNGAPVEYCIFDETNYVNPNSGYQSTGRAVLNSRDAIVIMPRATLVVGATYQASITANGQTTTWSFTVTSGPVRPETGTALVR